MYFICHMIEFYNSPLSLRECDLVNISQLDIPGEIKFSLESEELVLTCNAVANPQVKYNLLTFQLLYFVIQESSVSMAQGEFNI